VGVGRRTLWPSLTRRGERNQLLDLRQREPDHCGGRIDFSSDFSFVGNANPAATGRVQMFDRAFVGFVIRGLNVLFETLQGSPAAPKEVMRVTQEATWESGPRRRGRSWKWRAT